MERFRNELGVTMITVLFIGSALTAVATTASVITIQEFRASTDDRKAAEALGYAEAGIDRLILELRAGTYNWGQIRTSGCPGEFLVTESGTIGGDPNRTYDATLEVYNDATDPNISPADRLAPASCTASRLADTSPRTPKAFSITSEGEHPTARRVVRQIVLIKTIDLPIGIYGERIDANGSGGMLTVSMLSATDIVGREKIGFSGFDPYYTKADFYGRYGETSTDPIPAAAHAAGLIYYVAGGGSRSEHPPSPNCTANRTSGTDPGEEGQSLWDGSNWTDKELEAKVSEGCSGQDPGRGIPPTSLFTKEDLAEVTPEPNLSEQDYQALKESAKTDGLYCTPAYCTRQGVNIGPIQVVQDGDLGNLKNETNFIAYFDFPAGTDPFSAGNTAKWKAVVKDCNDDPEINRSMILIVRNGSISMESGAVVTGAVLIPEGAFDSSGSYTVHGTIIAKEFRLRGGANLQNSECWVNNMPGPFLDVTPSKWMEVDR